MMIRKHLNKLLSKIDRKLIKIEKKRELVDTDFADEEFKEIYSFCSSYTLTSKERMYALYNATKYIIDNNIKGDFVECGVWKGGSAMLIARYLKLNNIEDRKIYLYDTFTGMTRPGEDDTDPYGDNAIDEFLATATGEDSSTWVEVPLNQVKRNMFKTGFDKENIVFVQGKVEDTLPEIIPQDKISLLRLDTDWYESTKHELVHLYPILETNGVLIIDDYGHWSGSKKATLEYFKEKNETILLNKIGHTARVGIKTSPVV